MNYSMENWRLKETKIMTADRLHPTQKWHTHKDTRNS